jgi:hypothetical protein
VRPCIFLCDSPYKTSKGHENDSTARGSAGRGRVRVVHASPSTGAMSFTLNGADAWREKAAFLCAPGPGPKGAVAPPPPPGQTPTCDPSQTGKKRNFCPGHYACTCAKPANKTYACKRCSCQFKTKDGNNSLCDPNSEALACPPPPPNTTDPHPSAIRCPKGCPYVYPHATCRLCDCDTGGGVAAVGKCSNYATKWAPGKNQTHVTALPVVLARDVQPGDSKPRAIQSLSCAPVFFISDSPHKTSKGA